MSFSFLLFLVCPLLNNFVGHCCRDSFEYFICFITFPYVRMLEGVPSMFRVCCCTIILWRLFYFLGILFYIWRRLWHPWKIYFFWGGCWFFLGDFSFFWIVSKSEFMCPFSPLLNHLGFLISTPRRTVKHYSMNIQSGSPSSIIWPLIPPFRGTVLSTSRFFLWFWRIASFPVKQETTDVVIHMTPMAVGLSSDIILAVCISKYFGKKWFLNFWESLKKYFRLISRSQMSPLRW